MEKRVLLAIFLSFLVLYVYQALVAPPPPPDTASTSASPVAVAPSSAPLPDKPAEAVPPAEPITRADTLIGATTERDVSVENDQVIAVFTNRGARLKSWRLKHYAGREGAAVDLVPSALGSGHALPFSLRVASDETATSTLNAALYEVTESTEEAAPGTTKRVRFDFKDSSGLAASKEFVIEPSSYVVSFRAAVTQGDARVPHSIEWGPGLEDSGGSLGSGVVVARGLFAIADEVTRLAPDDVAEQPTYQGNYQFVGIDDHYFMSTALEPGASTVTYQAVTIPPPAGTSEPGRQFMSYRLETGVPDAAIRFYVGPKDFDILEAADPTRGLVRAIDFGVFAVIVVPLLRALDWIYGYVGNYGWAIVILTLMINILMFPLRHKQVVSMRKMQAIQPEVKAIQERYAKYKATDPAKQKMNQEMMALYRERGVNPAAGCLPMLLPLPVFFAFYALLTVAIELRGAPFVSWIQDLSRPDPYYVTPILMVLTQVLQTWMMPMAGGDPMQQKMMMFMPIVLGFIFLTMPSGVVVYWVVNNVWGIGQQVVTNRLIGPPNVRTVRPPAERRVKRVGAGKTDAAKEN
jgi:YidC/Oxa1 family membrane protein insertase